MALKPDPEFVRAFEPLAAIFKAAPKFAVGDINSRRAAFAGLTALFPQAEIAPGMTVTSHTFKSYDGAEISLFHIKPANPTPGAAVVHFHGGGYIAGSVSNMRQGITSLVARTNVQAFTVEYRLAPEFPYPTPHEDCYAGLLWVLAHASEFGIDPARVGVMGESAGGGLAAGVAILARDRKLNPPLAKQILVYPMINDRNTKDLGAFDDFMIWKADDNKTGWGALLGDKAGTDDVPLSAAAARITDVEGLPSTYIDCGSLDLFVDENVDYALKLLKGGIDVECHIYTGVPHGFELLSPSITATKLADANRERALKSF